MLLCISPHQDDAALSLGHIVNQLTDRLSVIFMLINCFTDTNYAPYINNNYKNNVKKIRLREDYKYLDTLKYDKKRIFNIDLPDSPLRKRWEMCNNQGDVCYFTYAEDEIIIYTYLLEKKLVEVDVETSIIFAPLGLLHKDHIITSRAVIKKYANHNVIFYEEVPYRYMIDEDEKYEVIKQTQKRLSYRLRNIDTITPHDYEYWLKCASKYKSQFSDAELEAMHSNLINSPDSILWGSDIVLNKAIKEFGLQLHYT